MRAAVPQKSGSPPNPKDRCFTETRDLNRQVKHETELKRM